MNKELDGKLVKRFPKLFRDRYAPMTETCMCWGFECGDGWYNILESLCESIQHHIDRTRKDRARNLSYNRALRRASKGNTDSLEKYHTIGTSEKAREYAKEMVKKTMSNKYTQYRDVPEVCPQVLVIQVKEKYGGLRFYYIGGDDCVDAMVDVAETMASKTCEVCGAPAAVGNGNMYVTCEKHA